MEILKQLIREKGKCFDERILKVDSFINHQIDPQVMYQLAEEITRRFAGKDINKILTIEASGIAPAVFVGHIMQLPVVFVKKSMPSTIEHTLYTTVHSFTKDRSYTAVVSKEFLHDTDHILFVDDFLAYGDAAIGVMDLCCQAGATMEGMAFIIEKEFQGGRQRILEAIPGVQIESLAIVKGLANNIIEFK